MKEALTGLVEDGTITQDEADKLSEIRSMPKDNCGIKDLTDEQKEAVMQAKMNAMKEAAANLVEKGTLTQNEADAISIMPSKIKAEAIHKKMGSSIGAHLLLLIIPTC
ncbi:MAG TPA: hypothetical protein VM577_11680 [Anaerovoracaceae bacterium]|nr:hypothetical protein [Anaerovoracaceae bacterium]